MYFGCIMCLKVKNEILNIINEEKIYGLFYSFNVLIYDINILWFIE